jgi:DNA-directed RNA polymerase specialized sigma24 family protein
MPIPADADLRLLLVADPERGWRAFVDAYTPTIVRLIERASLRDRDEAMEVYTLVCERLVEDRCARLRQWHPSKGALRAWLAVVVRRVVVDWVRARAGRRRLFGSVKALDPLDQRIFELSFWDERSPAEIVEVLGMERGDTVTLPRVLRGLDAVHAALTDRQRGELLSASFRTKAAASLEAELERGGWDPVDERADLEQQAVERDAARAFERVLGRLPAEDAAIVRLRYVEGLSLGDVRRALHLPSLNEARLREILDRIQAVLTGDTAHRSGRLATEGGGT